MNGRLSRLEQVQEISAHLTDVAWLDTQAHVFDQEAARSLDVLRQLVEMRYQKLLTSREGAKTQRKEA